jgi:Predicted nucleotide-utilizing enzyme related to molybdopterin-biosynthesis enzyme MoeA
MKASVLGIGTELVDGQTINRNASWISGKLKDLGLQTNLHLVVPDDKKLMLEGMDYCAANSDVLFITGGLGPTTDDFTRDVVAEWCGEKMRFDDASWKHINERLSSRGYVVRDIQRQQCYFPESASVMFNPEGTANGFTLNARGKKLFILPGPPREVAAVWNLSVHPWLVENSKHLDPHISRKWDTMGVGESDIATIVEEILAGVPEAEKGYRVHLPYVEVKLSYHRSEEGKYSPYVEKITEALRHCLVTTDGEDVAQAFAKELARIPSVSLIDSVTGQFLMNRLMPVMREFMTEKGFLFTNSGGRPAERSTAGAGAKAALHLEVLFKDVHTAELVFEHKGRRFTDIIDSPYKTANMKERRMQFVAEKALIFWLKHLRAI